MSISPTSRYDRGWLFCTVSLKERFAGDDMVFRGIPKGEGERFVRIVTEQTQRRQRGRAAQFAIRARIGGGPR